MKYEVLFDVSMTGYRDWMVPVTGLLSLCTGFFLVWNRKRLPTMFPGGMGPRASAVFAYFVFGFSVLWTAVAVAATVKHHVSLRDALRSGQMEVTEGRIRDFHAMPHTGHSEEKFTVCGVAFSYSDYIITGAFNQTSSHGGPMREGLWVRLSHRGNRIARIEIPKEDPGTPADCSTGGLTTR